MPMREWLKKVNGTNPQSRMICGFQPVYEADADALETLLQETMEADYFDILYTSPEVEVYTMCILRKDGFIRFHDIRFIAHLIDHESWLVSAGLIAVNRDSQLKPQVKKAKKALVRAINDIWGIDISLRKKQL